MLTRIRQFRGQSTLEYAVLVVIIIAALLSLQAYIKRGVQGRLRKSTDDIGDQFSTTTGATYNRNVVSNVTTHDSTTKEGVTTSEQIGEKYVNTTENITFGDASEEYDAGQGGFGVH